MLPGGEIVDLEIRGGRIFRIGRSLSSQGGVAAGGNLIMPGVIDAHVHLRDFSGAHKEDWLSGTKAAASGGITTLLDMPNNHPPAVDRGMLEEKALKARRGLVNFAFHLGATRDTPVVIREELSPEAYSTLPCEPGSRRIKLPVASLKIYLGSSTGDLLIEDEETLEALFSSWNGLFTIHGEDEATIRQNLAGAVPPEGQERHEIARDRNAAVNAVKRVLALAGKHGRRIHICHVSTIEEISLIRQARSGHCEVTCEVTPHNLLLTREDALGRGNLLKVNPPLRTNKDCEALWNALLDGTVDMIASDHAPHLKQDKLRPYDDAPSGLPGLETTLPLIITAASERGISMELVAEWLSRKPSHVFQLGERGLIEEGSVADLVLVDLKAVREVREEELLTKVRWSPFTGWPLKGWPLLTIVGGRIVYAREGFL